MGSRTQVDFTLREETQQVDAVVVTALGIKRSEKALSYNVQQVDSESLLANKDANFINSLNGKVAGVTINASSSGVGGASKVVMRGQKSISQSSNALYVIDGVPMFTTARDGGTKFGSQGTTDPIADINPEDIESLSVLNGAAAAALYGSDAANGAIVVTTKRGKAGRTSVVVSSNTEIMTPFVLPEFQNRYGTGDLSSSTGSIVRSWGHRLNSANYMGYDPADDYFQTGVTGTESVSFSTGNEKNQVYASAAAINSRGIVPNNSYDRYNFTFRNTTYFFKDRMRLDVGASYVLQRDRNMTNQGTYNNPLVGAYIFPRGDDWSDIQMYERYNSSRQLYTQYWPVGDAGLTMQNPYWINYRNLRENSKDRYMLNASLSYDILDWLNVSGRVSIDNTHTDYTEKMYASTYEQLSEYSDRGMYGITKMTDKQVYGDVLVNINKTFGENWSLQANAGASISDMRYDAMKVRGPIADGSDAFEGEKPGLANVFNIQNLSNSSKTKRLQEGWREQTQSVFFSAEVGFKNTYFLTVTGRNDWPSQLAGLHSEKELVLLSVGGCFGRALAAYPQHAGEPLLREAARFVRFGGCRFRALHRQPALRVERERPDVEHQYEVSDLQPQARAYEILRGGSYDALPQALQPRPDLLQHQDAGPDVRHDDLDRFGLLGADDPVGQGAQPRFRTGSRLQQHVGQVLVGHELHALDEPQRDPLAGQQHRQSRDRAAFLGRSARHGRTGRGPLHPQGGRNAG